MDAGCVGERRLSLSEKAFRKTNFDAYFDLRFRLLLYFFSLHFFDFTFDFSSKEPSTHSIWKNEAHLAVTSSQQNLFSRETEQNVLEQQSVALLSFYRS